MSLLFPLLLCKKNNKKYYKKNATFFDLFSFYVDLLFAAVVDVCAFI